MKQFWKKILCNTLVDIHTTIVGTIAGAPQLIEGIQNKNAAQIVTGSFIVLLGLISKSN
jgi:hypothetical protein